MRKPLALLVAMSAAFLGPSAPATAAGAYCSTVGATLIGTPGDDVLTGTQRTYDEEGNILISGNDVIVGLGGNDTIRGLTGDDLIRGCAGDDSIYGGWGGDSLDGGGGNDRLNGGPTGRLLVNRMYGRSGDDIIISPADYDNARGGLGNDWINLGPGDSDVADGGKGVDTCRGGFEPFGERRRCEKP